MLRCYCFFIFILRRLWCVYRQYVLYAAERACRCWMRRLCVWGKGNLTPKLTTSLSVQW